MYSSFNVFFRKRRCARFSLYPPKRLAECADASSLLDAAFALGVNVFDVAPVYGAGGAAETAVGKWLEAKLAEASQQRADNAFTRRGGVDGDATCRDGFFCRGDVYLVGKACHPAQGRPRLTPKALAEDVAASLRRLKGAQHLDLLLLHRDDPNVPAKEACVGAWLCVCRFDWHIHSQDTPSRRTTKRCATGGFEGR